MEDSRPQVFATTLKVEKEKQREELVKDIALLRENIEQEIKMRKSVFYKPEEQKDKEFASKRSEIISRIFYSFFRFNDGQLDLTEIEKQLDPLLDVIEEIISKRSRNVIGVKRLVIGVVIAVLVALTMTGLTYGGVISPEFFTNYLAETAGIGTGSFFLSLLIGFFVAFGYNRYCVKYKGVQNFTISDLFAALSSTIFEVQDQDKPQATAEHSATDSKQEAVTLNSIQSVEKAEKSKKIAITPEQWNNLQKIIYEANKLCVQEAQLQSQREVL